MKSAIFATVFAVAIAAVSAQSPPPAFDISKIPTCAVTCALSSITSTVCATTDFQCICKDSKFITTLQPCIVGQCNSADQMTMLTMATGLCSAYGVTIPANILTSSNATANGTVTARPSTPASTTTPVGTASTGGAVRMAGSGFVAAAMGAALFVL